VGGRILLDLLAQLIYHRAKVFRFLTVIRSPDGRSFARLVCTEFSSAFCNSRLLIREMSKYNFAE